MTNPINPIADAKPVPRADLSAFQVGGGHYKDMAVTPWSAMRVWLTPEEYRGYHKGTVLAYLARERSKGGDQDIAKAAHHLQELTEFLKCPDVQSK